MKKVKILVVGRLFQSELALLTSFENVELHVFETYDSFCHAEEDKKAFYDCIDGVIVWDECQHLLYEAIFYLKPVMYRNFRGSVSEEYLQKHLSFAKKENLTVLSFETVESDALYKYIKTQIPVFEKDYGKIMSVEGVLKAPFKPRVSNYIFEDEIGYVVDEYVRLLPFWFQSLYGFTGQYTLHQKYEHSKWGYPISGELRYLISADTDESLSSRQIDFEMKTKEGFLILFSNHNKKLSVKKNGWDIHLREIPVENYFEVIRPQFELFFKEVFEK